MTVSESSLTSTRYSVPQPRIRIEADPVPSTTQRGVAWDLGIMHGLSIGKNPR
jgi:hypothetical protein